MRVSIAMAAYNGAKYLKDQLESFAAQTRLPDELVVCDDMSIDGTHEILDAFLRVAPFDMKIIRNERNLGYTKNFEKAISLCDGDLIFLSDQDDVWLANKVQVCIDFSIERPRSLLFIHDGKLVDEKLIWHGATKLRQVQAISGNSDSLVTGALTVMRKDLIRYVLPVPEGIVGHDIWIHRVASLLERRAVLTIPLQLIRRHSSNTSESIASSVRKVDQRVFIWRALRSPVAKSYTGRAKLNNALGLRLGDIAVNDESSFSHEVLGRAFKKIAGERAAIWARTDVLSRGFFSKLLVSFRMLARGQYAYFDGLKSFIRDVLR